MAGGGKFVLNPGVATAGKEVFVGSLSHLPIVHSGCLTSKELNRCPLLTAYLLFQGWTDCPCLSLVSPELLGRNSINDLQLGVEREKTNTA